MQLFATLLILLPYAIGVSAFQVPLVVQPPNGAGVLTSASIAATPDVQCNQTGTIIAMPPAQTFNGTKPIPGICFKLLGYELYSDALNS